MCRRFFGQFLRRFFGRSCRHFSKGFLGRLFKDFLGRFCNQSDPGKAFFSYSSRVFGAPIVAVMLFSIFLAGCYSLEETSPDRGGAGELFGSSASNDEGTETDPETGADEETGSNIGFGGEQDFAYFRTQLDNGVVPDPDILQASGFFAEHHTETPPPDCGKTICLHTMLGVGEDMLGGDPRTILQIAMNTPIELNPEERSDLDLSLAIDISGSMAAENRIGYVRNGLLLMLDELFDDDKIAIITYSSEAQVLLPMTRVGDARDEIEDNIRSLEAGGSTALYAGLQLAYEEALEHQVPDRESRVILLSDGEANEGPSSNEEILNMSKTYNDQGTGLTTIGLGDYFNVELMRGLAEQGDGNYYYIGSVADVQDVFTVEVHSFTVPVATDLLIEVEEGTQYFFDQAWGSPHWEDGPNGGTLELPSVFAAWRKSHDDTTETGGRRGGGSALLLQLEPRPDIPENVTEAEVTSVTLSYEDIELGEYVNETVEVMYPHHPTYLVEEGYFSGQGQNVIMKSFAMLHAFLALKEGCIFYHEGRGLEGIELLELVLGELSEMEPLLNGGEGDEDIRLDMALIEQLADVIDRNL